MSSHRVLTESYMIGILHAKNSRSIINVHPRACRQVSYQGFLPQSRLSRHKVKADWDRFIWTIFQAHILRRGSTYRRAVLAMMI
jgi:hypothetical protein